MSMVIDTYDQFVAQGTIKSKSDDVAFNTDSRRDKGCTTKKFDGDCYNCGWHGHRGRDCWEEGGKKHSQAPKGWRPQGKKNKDSKDSKPPRSANVAADEKEPDAVWLVDSFTDKPEAMLSLPFATLAYTGMQTNTVELYDSGTSQHLSPYREHFVNFVAITPKPIMAADKHTFDATGRGDLYFEIPNGNTKARILLKNVLYAPSMGVTLVSISKLAAAGYAALFCDSVCRIFNPQRKLVGEIPISNGLYRVRHTVKQPFAGVANATEVLTMEELHTCLSHVAPSMICNMLTKGMVEGVKLDRMHLTMGQCESCEYGKSIRKPIGTVREPKQSE